MAMPDRGPSVKYSRFERRANEAALDLSRSRIITVLAELSTVGNTHTLATTDWRPSRLTADKIIFDFVQPVWGEREGCPRILLPSIPVVDMELSGEEIFVGSRDAELTRSFAHGRDVLKGVHRARSLDSVLSGLTVFGTGGGSNDPKFNPEQLAVISDIAGGIKGTNKKAVDNGLAHLDRMMTNEERQFEGRIDGDTTYAAYPHSSAAKVFDRYYLPWVAENSQDIIVQGSLVHAFRVAFGSVLGGEVRDSAIVAGGAVFPHANLEIYNTHVLTANGSEYIEHTTRGNPLRAREAIEAVQDLPLLPLAKFAQ